MIMWLASVFVIFTIGGTTLKLPDGFAFPISILVWGLVFFLGGFGLYASLQAGAGALIPRMKEAGAANFIAMIPLLFGYIVGLLATLAEVGDAALPIILSFFPFTSPVVMIMRLTDGSVPLWHLLVSAGLLYASAYLALRAAAAMFHAHNLLSGQPFSVKRYITVMIGNK
jgi:ABC-2 type transport system permease protein